MNKLKYSARRRYGYHKSSQSEFEYTFGKLCTAVTDRDGKFCGFVTIEGRTVACVKYTQTHYGGHVKYSTNGFRVDPADIASINAEQHTKLDSRLKYLRRTYGIKAYGERFRLIHD
jgi:hypothetical protein